MGTIYQKLREIFKLLSVPITLFAVYLGVLLVWKALGLPDGDQLIGLVKGYFARYGLAVVFISALIEGFLIVGQYFPGGTIVFLGVITAGRNIPRVAEVVVVVMVAFFIAYTFNYLVGKYGWHRILLKFGLRDSLERAKQKLEQQGLNAIILSYWEPNLASITATAAGTLYVPLKKFQLFSAIGIVVWETFWGVLIYFLGNAALAIIGLKYVFIIFIAWIGIILLRQYIIGATRRTAEMP